MQLLSKAHLKLYKFMKGTYERDGQFRKEDMLDIYDRYASKRIRKKDYIGNAILTDEQIYQNASIWLNRSIAVLVRHGYLGLTFRKECTCDKELVEPF